MFAFILLLLACSLDAFSTIALLRRGGSEWFSAWAIGAHPPAWKVWAWVVVLPLLLCVLVVSRYPQGQWLFYLLAVWRAGAAWRNHQLQREA